MTPVPDAWYVQYDGQPYGPYSHVQMRGFVDEGRVIKTSLISPDPSRGFFNAGDFPIFAQWTAASEPQLPPEKAPNSVSRHSAAAYDEVTPQIKPTPTEAMQRPAQYMTSPRSAKTEPHNMQPKDNSLQRPKEPQTAQIHDMQAHAQRARQREPLRTSPAVLLVMAEIRSAQGMPFLQALQAHGVAQRIGDSVWLLRTDLSADALRSTLSRTLSKQDRLFILDSFNNKTAWFNIGADMDGRIRDLWEEL